MTILANRSQSIYLKEGERRDMVFTAPHLDEGPARIQIILEQGSKFSCTLIQTKENAADLHIEAEIKGSGAVLDMRGVMMIGAGGQTGITAHVRHLAAGGRSRQNIRALVRGDASAYYTGCVHVNHGAQKTDAQQLVKTILLSPRARMQARPELEIYADDVSCAHGATCGAIDDQILFYMMNRGLSFDQARALILQGFISDVLDHMDDAAQAEIMDDVEHFLKEDL